MGIELLGQLKRFLLKIISISFLAIYFRTFFFSSIRFVFALFPDLVSEVSQESNLAKIHINTISSYNGFGGGIYKMTSIKELKGTKDFLAMDRKSCAMEANQDCVDRNILQKCECNLWEVALGQVNPFLQLIRKNTKNWYAIDALGVIFAILALLKMLTLWTHSFLTLSFKAI